MPLDNREQLHHWSKAILAGMNLRESEEAPRLLMEATTAVKEFSAHIRNVIAEKRSHPDEHLMSRLIAAADAGDQLRSRGRGDMHHALLCRPRDDSQSDWQRFVGVLKNPDQLVLRPELINSAVEEFARYDSPDK
ncbi:MAG: hypothetical protein ACR2G5_08800 [Pyrinomonadaceae bacterium]